MGSRTQHIFFCYHSSLGTELAQQNGRNLDICGFESIFRLTEHIFTRIISGFMILEPPNYVLVQRQIVANQYFVCNVMGL